MQEQWCDPRLSLTFRKECYEIYVGSLPYRVNEEDVRELFEQFGTVISVILPINRAGNLIGAGFVLFERESDAKRAIEKLDRTEWKGRTIYVEERRGQGVGRYGPRGSERDIDDRRDYGRRDHSPSRYGRYDDRRGRYDDRRDDRYDDRHDRYDDRRDRYDRRDEYDRRDMRYDDYDRGKSWYPNDRRGENSFFEEDPEH